MSSEKQHYEVILAGSGGQGLILAGILLAEAAILEGKNVVQTQAYGIASRGGMSQAEVIVDSEEIIFTQVQEPDCIVALIEEAMKKFEPWAGKGVPILYDSTLVEPRTGANISGFPFTQTSCDLGSEVSVNVLFLGSLAAKTGMVKMESLEQAIRQRFKGPAVEVNLKFLAAGRDLVNG